jgi:hypothetical protein
MEMAPRGQTSIHNPHPIQVSQSTIMVQTPWGSRIRGFMGSSDRKYFVSVILVIEFLA